jgi:hypothetical protein
MRLAQTYPIQKQALTTEYLRDHCHLRARTDAVQAMLRTRDCATTALHDYFKVGSPSRSQDGCAKWDASYSRTDLSIRTCQS